MKADPWHRALSWVLALILFLIVFALAGTGLELASVQPKNLGVGVAGLAATASGKAAKAAEDRHRLGVVLGLAGSVADAVGAARQLGSAKAQESQPSSHQGEALLESIRAERRALAKIRHEVPELFCEANAVAEALAEVSALSVRPWPAAADLESGVRALKARTDDLLASAGCKIPGPAGTCETPRGTTED